MGYRRGYGCRYGRPYGPYPYGRRYPVYGYGPRRAFAGGFAGGFLGGFTGAAIAPFFWL